jgi:tetratricopeptide (TPR) repeat protein
MIESSIHSIYDDFRVEPKKTPDFIIDFYTKNVFFFNSVRTFEDKEDLKLYIELIWQYLNALYKKKRYNETIDETDKLLSIINNEIERLGAEDVRNDLYYDIIFNKGASYYYLKNYKNSTPIFRMLLLKDNKNEGFKIWFEYSRSRERQKNMNSFIYASGFIMVVYIFFGDYLIKDKETRLYTSILLAAIWIAILGYARYLDRNFRKKNFK